MDSVTLEIVKAVGPVVGGAVSAAVGWLASSFLHSMGARAKRREFYLLKLEELSRAAHGLQGKMALFISKVWLMMHNRVMMDQSTVEEMEKCLSEIVPVYQIQGFYFPALEAHASAVEATGTAIGKLVMSYREKPEPQKAFEQLNKLAFEFASVCANLRSAAAEEAKKFTP